MKINEKNLSYFATTEPFDKCGLLNKRGELNKGWQKRWFILKGNLLFYFEKRYDKEPVGMIILEGCTIEMAEAESGSDQYCFKIIFHGPHNRTYVMSAESQEVMESWMKALTCASYDYMKLMVAELQRQLKELEEAKNESSNDANSQNPPIAPPRRVAPQKPQNMPSKVVPEAAPLGGSGENKDPNLLTTFQRIHEMIGAPIIKEIEEYRKLNPSKRSVVSSTGSMASPDGAPLISF